MIVPSDNETTKSWSDLTQLARIAIDDPTLSTLGARAQAGLNKLGLWDKLAPKVVHFDPEKNVLSQLLEGKADAAVVFKDCLFEGGVAPSTIRLVDTLPEDSYDPVVYRVAPGEVAPPDYEGHRLPSLPRLPRRKRSAEEGGPDAELEPDQAARAAVLNSSTLSRRRRAHDFTRAHAHRDRRR